MGQYVEPVDVGAADAKPRLRRSGSESASVQAPAPRPKHAGVTICTLQEAPAYQALPFISHGYRVNHSFRDAVLSWFTLHADTVNIWTHFAGFLYFVWGAAHVSSVLSSTGASPWEYVSFGFYILCAMFQFAASVVYHTVRCISVKHDEFFLKLDVSGIGAMIVGSYVVGLHQGFFCQPSYIYIYLGVLLSILSVAGVMMTQPGYQSTEWDGPRNTVLSSAVAFGIFPCVHWAVHCDFHCLPVVVWAMVGMFGNYFVGFLFFVARFPERWFPRTFDILGASHQIWHVFVVAAGVSWLHGMVAFHEWRSEHRAHCEFGEEVPAPMSGT